MEGGFWSPRSKWHELSGCSDPTNRSHHHEPALQQTNQTGWHCLDASAATNQLHQSVLVRKQITAPKTTIGNIWKLIPWTNYQTLLKLTLISLQTVWWVKMYYGAYWIMQAIMQKKIFTSSTYGSKVRKRLIWHKLFFIFRFKICFILNKNNQLLLFFQIFSVFKNTLKAVGRV